MTDIYNLDLSGMSNELPSIIDTKYSTLAMIQRSLTSNNAQVNNAQITPREAIRARRLQNNTEIKNLQYSVVFNFLSLIYFGNNDFHSDIYRQTLETDEFYENINPTSIPRMSGLRYKFYDSTSEIEKYINESDIDESEIRDSKEIESVLLKLLEMAASTRMPSIQKVIDHSLTEETEEGKRNKFDGALINNLIRHIKDWSERREIARQELLHSAFRERLMNTIKDLSWVEVEEIEGVEVFKSAHGRNFIYSLNLNRASATGSEINTLNSIRREMRKFHEFIQGLDIETIERNQDIQENSDRVFNAPQILRTNVLKEKILPFLFIEKELILSEQHIYDIFSEMLEDYTGTYRTISNMLLQDGEEVDIFSNIPDSSIDASTDLLSLRNEVTSLIKSLPFEEIEILLISNAFLHIVERVRDYKVKLLREISDTRERNKYRLLIKNIRDQVNFPPMKINMTEKRIIEYMQENLIKSFYNKDFTVEDLFMESNEISNKVLADFPQDEIDTVKREIYDILSERQFIDFTFEIYKEGEESND